MEVHANLNLLHFLLYTVWILTVNMNPDNNLSSKLRLTLSLLNLAAIRAGNIKPNDTAVEHKIPFFSSANASEMRTRN